MHLISMFKKFVKDYFSFTKKDRVGVIVLLSLIFITVLLPSIWPAKKDQQPGKLELEKLKQEAAQLNKVIDAPASATATSETTSANNNYSDKKEYSNKKYELFYFDPNTLDADGWQRLGVREKTANTIQKYISKGGKFRKPEDISKIYGLYKDQVDKLLPYVRIASAPVVEKKYETQKKEYGNEPRSAYPVSYPAKKTFPAKKIDINTADTTALIALPGIGSKLAARIINFRDKLGGFYSVKQVAETYGLPDSTFNKIQTSLQCNSAAVKQININTADANTLKQHPYIRWNLANAIVQYRSQHGNFKTVNDLQQIATITPEIFEKIAPYLSIQ